MKKILLVVGLLLVGFLVYWFKFRSTPQVASEPKQQALKVGRHSAAFYKTIDTTLGAYFNIQYALVDADTAKAKAAASQMVALAKGISLEELKKDTTGIFEAANMQLNDVVANAESLVKQKNITDIRQDFRMVGENIYPLLKTIHYEGKTLYWQTCPMAFGEGKEAYWLSSTAEVVNPYLGKNHPEFKAGMLHCGEVVDSIKAE